MPSKNSILIILVFLFAFFQAPFIYYYTSGILAMIIIPCYMLAGAIFNFSLLKEVFKQKKTFKNNLQRITLIVTVVMGIGSLFLERQVEYLDWNLRKSTREEIIGKVKEGEVGSNVPLKNWSFPPISNGGNEIAIYKGHNEALTVEFYINRGVRDHYSAFVYTEDEFRKSEIEERIIMDNGKNSNFKLEENWYRVSY